MADLDQRGRPPAPGCRPAHAEPPADRLPPHALGPQPHDARLGVSPAYWSRVEREQENPPRDDLVERVAAILEVKLDDLFCEAGRLPPDLRGDIKAVVTLYRRSRDTRNPNSK